MGRNWRNVATLAYDGLGAFEFGIVAEVFGLRRTGMATDWYDFAVCSVERKPVRATGGVTMLVPHGLRRLQRAGTIVIPGWKYDAGPAPRALLNALRSAHAAGARLVSICSGVF